MGTPAGHDRGIRRCIVAGSGDESDTDPLPAVRTRKPVRRLRSLRTKIEVTEALTPRVLVQRLFDATLGGRSLGLGLVDCRFGQLGDPIGGCDCI